MNQLFKFFFAFILSVCFSQIQVATNMCYAAEWKQLKNADGTKIRSNAHTYYYDLKSITITSDSTIEVWTKNEAGPTSKDILEVRKGMIAGLREFNLPTDGFEGYLYSLDKHEYDCKNHKSSLLKSIDYDEEGNSIGHSAEYKEKEWVEVVPESVGEAILQAICRIKNKMAKAK